MSISPQSLARTRDKRSLRIPARFDDFCEIRPEAYRPVPAEALKMGKSKQPKRHTISNDSPPEPLSKRAVTSELSAKRPPPRHRSTTPASSTEALTKEPELKTIDDPEDIDLECKETTPAILDFKPELEIKRLVREDEFIKKMDDDKGGDAVENLDLAFASRPMPTNIIKKVDDNVIKSPFHPIIKVASGFRIVKKKPNSPTPVNGPNNTTNSASSRKRSKGFSLMAKPANGLFQSNNNNINRPNPQQTKYFNNLTQNMQYGTRLMLNEPVYLPRSVATIAPITTTLQQIANQARQPPFVSKKAEEFIAYQEKRKFNYLASNYTALVKITKYLEVGDLLNLRLVNKSWKSIVDSDTVWKRITISSSEITNWPEFAQKILCKYQTTDLVMEDYLFSDYTITGSHVIEALSNPTIKLKRLWIKTSDPWSNKFALELLCGLNNATSKSRRIRIIWKVKIEVNDCGLALVPIAPMIDNPDERIYHFRSTPPLFKTMDTTELVELSDLEDLFNGGKRDLSASTQPFKPRIDIKPI